MFPALNIASRIWRATTGDLPKCNKGTPALKKKLLLLHLVTIFIGYFIMNWLFLVEV